MSDKEIVIKRLKEVSEFMRCRADIAAIGKARELFDSWYRAVEDALALLREQEPVIVRCKDCKHYAVEDHFGNFHGYEILAASDVPTCHRWGNDACMVKPDGYCFLAERR